MKDDAIRAIRRPHPNLLWLYVLKAAATLFAFPVVFPPLFFRYHTLQYTFDEEGISASWGILFKREVYLTYKRIQDIHVRRNLIERWMGIGRVEIQTASGSGSAELSLEGMEHYAAIRDYLYRHMRGTARTAGEAQPVGGASTGGATTGGADDEAVALLRAIRDDLVAVRDALENRGERS